MKKLLYSIYKDILEKNFYIGYKNIIVTLIKIEDNQPSIPEVVMCAIVHKNNWLRYDYEHNYIIQQSFMAYNKHTAYLTLIQQYNEKFYSYHIDDIKEAVEECQIRKSIQF